MRILIKHDLDKIPETFILTDLWFADKDADFTQYPPKGYMCLSGLMCHTHNYNDEEKEYSTLWKGVSMHDESTVHREIDNYIETWNLIKNKVLIDVSGCVNDSYINDKFKTQINEITFVFGDMRFKLEEEQFASKQFVVNGYSL